MVKGVTANNVTNTPGASRRSVPAQPRWPADHAASGRLGVRPAQGQPGGDRRVPDRDEHVRHHAGPVDRDAGAGDLPLGHQRSARLDLWVLPQRQLQRGRPRHGHGAAVPEPAGRRHPGRPDHPEQDALLRRPTSTSGNRPRRSWRRRGSRTRRSQFQSKSINKNYLGRVDYQTHRPRTPSRSAGSAGRSTTRSRSRAARRIRRPPNSSRRIRPTSSAPGRMSSAPT